MAKSHAYHLLAGVWGCLLFCHSVFAAEPQFNAYLTAAEHNGIPLHESQEHFDCSDTVYVVIEASTLADGQHILETEWEDPDGVTREETSHEFHSGGGNARVWSWLRLHGPNGVAAAVARAFDPSLGMEAFIGEWSVNVEFDDNAVAQLRFEVLC